MKTLLLGILVSVLGTACVVDTADEPRRYSCLIRFQCVGSDDILARQYFACSTGVEDAEDVTQDASLGVAADRCGESQWSWTWVECDDEATASRCEAGQ